MKKSLQLTFMSLFLVQFGFSQQLQNTQWTTTWGAPINDEVCFTFVTDTLVLSGSTGNEISTTLYTENGNTMTVQDIAGPFSCPNADVGTYQFEIVAGGGGTVLNFTLDSDPCTTRGSFVTSNGLTPKNVTGINNLTTIQFNIYPNPVTDLLTIKATGQHGMVLYNALGKRVFQRVFANKMEIDCSSYPRGTYLVKVDRSTRKLIFD